jgi:hypothetical protein
MATENNNKIEAILVLAILASLTFLCYTDKISGDVFQALLAAMLGYVFGRVVNHKTGSEP